jgi:formylglycine-generating enzyme required for sulfatase activity
VTDEAAFTAALPLGPAQRTAYLRAACPDPAQRARVEALLAAHAEANSFLERPVPGRAEVGTNTRTFSPDAPDEGADENDPLVLLAPPGRPDSKGRIGHYEVLQVLGRGGFGAVYRAFDEMLHRVVAVKVLLRHIAATSPARKRFLREARTLAQVRHENVVQVYEVGEAPLPYLVMEFVPGETLQARLDRVGPVEPAEVVRIGREIAEGLAAAHAQGLIHRDIKPGNVLLESPQLRVKITDFGLARAADDASVSQSGVVAGTPMYMAPEQARGDHIDHRADLFSLGSVLYQMLSGRPPFRAANTLAVLKRVCDDAPRPIREIIPEAPKWLCDIVAKLHAKNPDDRFQTAREVADVLAACEERLKSNTDPRGFPQVTTPEQTETVAFAPPARKPKWRAAALALVAGAAALLVALWPAGTRLTVAGDGVGLILTDEVNGTVREVSAGDSQVPAGYYRVSPRCGTDRRIDTVLVTEGVLTREVGAADFQVKWNRGDRVTVTVRTAPRPVPAPVQPTLPASYTGVPPKAIRGNDTCIAYQYSPDGKWLVTRDYANNTIGAMRVWEVATGEVRATIPNSLGSGGAFSPDSKLLAHPEREGGRVHLVVRNVGTFDVVKRMDCAANNVEGIAFDRTGTVVAACVDYDVVLWTARTGAEVLRLASDFHGLLGLAFSPTADRLLLQEDRGSFQRDGRWDHDSRIHLYDTDPKSPTYKQRLRTWDAPNDGFAFGMIHFSPDGARALFCRGENGLTRVAVHDVKTGAKVREIVPQQTYTQITIGAISPDGKRVVLRHGPDGVHVSVWNLDTGARVSGFDLTGKAHRAFAVDPTFRTACIGFHTSSEAKFYDLATGKELVPGAAGVPPAPAIAPFDGTRAKAHQEQWARHLGAPVEFTNPLGMKFRLIPPGEFQMGSATDDAKAPPDEQPQHPVRLTRAFHLGTTEVTVRQFGAFVAATKYKTVAEGLGGAWGLRSAGGAEMKAGTNWQERAKNWTGKGDSDNAPVLAIAWADARAFCDWLGTRDGRRYRLPTEAEWEFACRAGTVGAYWFGSEMDERHAHFGPKRRQVAEVGTYPANPFGLFDTHGNASEWCADAPRSYAAATVTDPVGTGLRRVHRGGHLFSKADFGGARSADRAAEATDRPIAFVGFRVACAVADPPRSRNRLCAKPCGS